MPIRGLMYFGKLYDTYIVTKGLNAYGRKLIKIPTPKYVVLYNDTENRESIEKLRLSDAFTHKDASREFV